MGGPMYHKRGKRTGPTVHEIILRTILDSGSIILEELAQNAIKRFGPSFGLTRKSDPRYDIPRSVRRLMERGLLEIRLRKGQEFLSLTEKGRQTLVRFTHDELVLKKPKVWDKKWRVVIYDIREERKLLRGELKRVLEGLGFVMVQKSVWVYPYPCEDLLLLLKADFRVGKEVLYLVVERMENDGWIRKHFKLP
jgi:CRISPR/Cas system-associated endoribonuclease Cas2